MAIRRILQRAAAAAVAVTVATSLATVAASPIAPGGGASADTSTAQDALAESRQRPYGSVSSGSIVPQHLADRHVDLDIVAQDVMQLHRVAEEDVPPAVRRRAWQAEEDAVENEIRGQARDGADAQEQETQPPDKSGPAGSSIAKSNLDRLDRANSNNSANNPPQHPPPLTLPSSGLANVHDVYYLVNISINGQSVLVNLDTGSSDTWVVGSNYQCVSLSGFPKSKRACGFGTPFTGTLEPLAPQQPFRRFFGDGTFATGTFGRADVTLGGLTAHRQQIAVVNRTHWYGGDGRSSGLLGLAYPSLTGAALTGTKPDGGGHTYDPIFTTLWRENATSPVFTLALSRYEAPASAFGGPSTATSYIAFGGVPPTVLYDDATWSRTPIEPLTTGPAHPWGFPSGLGRGRTSPASPVTPGSITTPAGLYIITPTAFVYSKRARNGTMSTVTTAVTTAAAHQVSVDAGSTLTTLPAAIAGAVFGAFDPPPHWVPSGAAYYAPCNARVPTLGVQFGVQVYYMAAADLLRQNERDAETGRYCRVGILDGDAAPYTLGVTFLTNVIAVFDIGLGEIRLASRTPY